MGRRADPEIQVLDTYLLELSQVRTVQVRNEIRQEILKAHFGKKWTVLGDRLMQALVKSQGFEELTEEAKESVADAESRRAVMAFAQAITEVSWLASLFVFRSKEAETVRETKGLLLARQFDKSYEVSRSITERMRFAYVKGYVEKGVYYAATTILAFLTYGSAGLLAGLGLLAIIFAILPYYTYSKLFYD